MVSITSRHDLRLTTARQGKSRGRGDVPRLGALDHVAPQPPVRVRVRRVHPAQASSVILRSRRAAAVRAISWSEMDRPPPRYWAISAHRGQSLGFDHAPGGADARGDGLRISTAAGRRAARPGGGLTHRLGGDVADRRDAGGYGGQRRPAPVSPQPPCRLRRDERRVERHSGGRAARPLPRHYRPADNSRGYPQAWQHGLGSRGSAASDAEMPRTDGKVIISHLWSPTGRVKLRGDVAAVVVNYRPGQ